MDARPIPDRGSDDGRRPRLRQLPARRSIRAVQDPRPREEHVGVSAVDRSRRSLLVRVGDPAGDPLLPRRPRPRHQAGDLRQRPHRGRAHPPDARSVGRAAPAHPEHPLHRRPHHPVRRAVVAGRGGREGLDAGPPGHAAAGSPEPAGRHQPPDEEEDAALRVRREHTHGAHARRLRGPGQPPELGERVARHHLGGVQPWLQPLGHELGGVPEDPGRSARKDR